MEKLIVVPFVVVLAVVFGLLIALASYAGIGANPTQTGTNATPYVYAMSAIFQDATTGDSVPCSAVGLTVTCAPTFLLHPQDRVNLLVSVQNKGKEANMTFSGYNGVVSLGGDRWSVPAGASQRTLSGLVQLSSAQVMASMSITLSVS